MTDQDVVENKTLLITGGTGSFGKAVLKRFLDSGIKQIRIFSRDEKKQDDLRRELNSPKVQFYLGDVRDINSIRTAMPGVDIVFHAAALKQVPSCEFFPMQAVLTNTIGTDNMLQVANECRVSKVVCLSTDKAAYPINAMGMSKAMMEKIAVARARLAGENGQTIVCTRYGNVMASRGSVIPLFAEKLRLNQPLTVTDPTMTRFMMSLDEAVDLVFFALANGNPGDIFVQKAPAATMETLALAMIRLFHSGQKIEVIGTRHGEKQYETLLTKEERIVSEDLGKYFRVSMDGRNLNYGLYVDKGLHNEGSAEDYNSMNTDMLSLDQMVEKLQSLKYIRQALDNFHLPEGD